MNRCAGNAGSCKGSAWVYQQGLTLLSSKSNIATAADNERKQLMAVHVQHLGIRVLRVSFLSQRHQLSQIMSPVKRIMPGKACMGPCRDLSARVNDTRQ